MANGLLAKNGIIVTGSIEVQNAVTASAFSGDGSGLSGVSDFPYTGSAAVSGSVDVNGNIEFTKRINGIGITTNSNNNSIYITNGDSDILSVGNYQTIIKGAPGGNYAVHVGNGAGYGRTSVQNVIVGTNAGSYGNGSQIGSTLIGHGAGIGYNSYSTVVGNGAGTGVKGVYAQVYENVNIGRAAGGNIINYSTTIGSFSGRALLGDYNITVGHHTGYNGVGDNLIFLGKEAGYNASGSNNILIGHQAGYNLTGSNQLIIANTGSHALVTGDFANNTFNISGSVSASTYYGDGSNLTGISSNPFPYTGSAEISGSLEVIDTLHVGSSTNPGTLHIIGNTGGGGAGTPSLKLEGTWHPVAELDITLNTYGAEYDAHSHTFKKDGTTVLTLSGATSSPLVINGDTINFGGGLAGTGFNLLIGENMQTRNHTSFLYDWLEWTGFASDQGYKFHTYTYKDLIVLNGSTGRVGIGTSSPSTKLEVSGSIKSSGLSVGGTQRSLYTTQSFQYDGSNLTQITMSFENGTEEITNITYDGSNVDTIVITGSDGINKTYTLSYDGSGNVTNIIVS